MLEQLKKNWFVLVVAAILLIASGVYVVDQTKSVVKGKKVDGEQVVFSIAGHNFMAKDYQESLDSLLGDSALYQLFEKELLTNLSISEDEAVAAKLRAETYLNSVKQSQGSKGLSKLDSDLKALGYDGTDSLAQYFENITKYENLVKDYFMTNYDTLFKDYVEEKQPRLVKHILVSIADPDNLTEAETAKIERIEQALADGKAFEEVALSESDDTSSAQNGGSLGVVDADANLVESFLDTMLTLNAGEQSDWVDSDYGKHLIYVSETDFEKLLKDSDYFTELTELNATQVGNAIWEAASSLDIKFIDPEVENKIKSFLGIDKEEA